MFPNVLIATPSVILQPFRGCPNFPKINSNSNRQAVYAKIMPSRQVIHKVSFASMLKNCATSSAPAIMSSYDDLMSVVDGGVFQCRPDCFAECLPDDCPAHRQAIKHYEAVVQRLESAEKAVMMLQEENHVLKKAQESSRLERAKLIKLLPIETQRELPGPSQSPTSPAKKRRADSREREVSRKRRRIEPPSAPRPPAPTPAPAPAPVPAPFAAPVPAMVHAARRPTSIPSPCTTQASQLKPAPVRRPGRPRDLTLSRGLFEEVVEELRRDYHGSVLSSQVPMQSSLLMEEYLNSLWATARLVTKRDRRKVVTKYDVKSALYQRADIIL
ncbi:hypothetical protein CDAR_462031 [Caerostris darwini]|uniref:Histone H2A/H2B/H3 domain-containing protein n=1 Tax=Caerostris darwini TaxID=1538125 RepID=A0AAV4WTP7_9ARAC|nr:hypothetical protein CDAR_462031 [Caerostris darwini]